MRTSFPSLYTSKSFYLKGLIIIGMFLFLSVGEGFTQANLPVMDPLDSSTYTCDECSFDSDCATGMRCENGICLWFRDEDQCVTDADCYGGGSYTPITDEVFINEYQSSTGLWHMTSVAGPLTCAEQSPGGTTFCSAGGGSGAGSISIGICECGNGQLEDDFINSANNEQCDSGLNCNSSCMCESGYMPDPNGNGCISYDCQAQYDDGYFTLEVSECEALVDLYNSTNGDGWNDGDTPSGNSDSWKIHGSDPCDWYGVTCGGNNVTMISMFDNGLSGTLPTTIGDFSSLDTLNFDNNGGISGNMPSEIGNLSSLIYLNLSDSGMSGSLPGSISSLSSLETLMLSFANFSGPIDDIMSLTNLVDLRIQGNNFSGSIPSSIGNLSSLEKFIASFNNFSGSIPSGLGTISSLETITLNSNDLSGIIPPLTNTTSSINLQYNDFTGKIPEESLFSNTNNLYLANNDFEGAIPQSYIGNSFGNLILNGSNYVCGDVSPVNRDSPFDDNPSNSGSSLCDDGVFCNDNADCYSNNCNGNICSSAPLEECGASDGTVYYTATATVPDQASQGPLCTNSGTAINLGNSWDWDCQNETGCSAINEFCGDGIVSDGTNGTIDGGEVCDSGVNCNTSCQCAPGTIPDPNGTGCLLLEECGSADDVVEYYTIDKTRPDLTNPIEGLLCTNSGVFSNLQDTGNDWIWDCVDENSCDTINHFCGDGTVNDGNNGTYDGGEECDDSSSGSECDNTCQCNTGFEPDPSGNGCVASAFLCSDPAVTIPLAECEALLDFYDDLNGDSWNSGATGSTDGWKEPGTDPCTWYGVTCNGSNVEMLGDANTLAYNNLDGGIPTTIEDLSQLYWFDVEGNNIDDIPFSFQNLQLLEYIDISDNDINGSAPILGFMDDLYFADFSSNDLDSNIDNVANSFTNGLFLDLSNNFFDGDFPDSLGTSLGSNVELHIQGNQFEGAFPDSYVTASFFELYANGTGLYNYTCGDTTPSTWQDTPFDTQNGSPLCIDGVFCNDNDDCQSANCDSNVCQPSGNTEYTCDANGTWIAGVACTTVDYDANAAYTPTNVACSDTVPANTTCVVCGDGEVETGETCDGSGQAQCNTGETCNQTTCGCEVVTTGNTYTCEPGGDWSIAGASCSPVDYTQGTTTYERYQTACADVVPDNIDCSDSGSVCDHCTDSSQCGFGGTCTVPNPGTPLFCDYDGTSCSVLGEPCGGDLGGPRPGTCTGVCSDSNGNPPAYCQAPIDGVCGSEVFMQDFYRPDEPITNGDLCDAGSEALYTYLPDTGWTWRCIGDFGGATVACSATELYCGDTFTQNIYGEECDDGGNTSGNGCNASCDLENIPACTLTPDTQAKPAGSTWTLNGTKPTWVTSVVFDYNDGSANDTNSVGGGVTFSSDHSYTTIGEYNPTVSLVHPFGGDPETCTTLVQSDGSAVCGTDANQVFYDGTQPSTSNACAAGSSLVGTIDFNNTTHQWTWSCTSQYASSSINCVATQEYCGDGVINGPESCDGSDLDSNTCVDQGFGGGTLACDSQCGFDVTSCEAAVSGACETLPGSYTAAEFMNLTNEQKCASGTYLSGNPNPNGGNWTWICEGEFGGTNSGTCTAPVTVNADCGSAANSSHYADELNDINDTTLCDDGSPAPDLALANNIFTWTCGGNTCQATESVDAVCGTTVVNPSATVPTQDLCDFGTATSVSETTTDYEWTCNGLNGGISLPAGSCNVSITPTCADLTGQSFASASDITDSVGCDTGSVTNGITDLGGSFEWTCSNGGFESATCAADKDIAPLSCAGLNYDLQLTDLGYTRFSPYLDENFTSVWTEPTEDGVSITEATFDGVVISLASESHTTSVDTSGIYNYVFSLENQYSNETLNCTFPITIEAYQHSKTVYAVAFDNSTSTHVITYRVESAMPETYDVVTLSDRITYDDPALGYADITISSLRILNADGTATSTRFEIIDTSVIPQNTDIDGNQVTYGFDLAVQATTPGNYGNFILEYEAVALANGDEVCNICEIVGDNGGTGGGATTFIDKVYAQTSFAQSNGVCVIPDPDPDSCSACATGYNPCPGREAEDGEGENQSSNNVANEGMCSTVDYCGCYEIEQDTCQGSCNAGYEECEGAEIGGGADQSRSHLATSCDAVTDPDPCSCGIQIACDESTLLENTVACEPTNPTEQTQGFEFDPTGTDYTTCGGNEECGMICEEGAVFDPAANGLAGGCILVACDESTKIDESTLPSGATLIDCSDEATVVDEAFTFAANQNECDTVTSGCYYFVDCGFGQEWVGDETTGSCTGTVDIEKIGEEINGSVGTFTINATVGAVADGYEILIFDSLENSGSNPNLFTNVEIISSNGISGGSCIRTFGTSFECDGFIVDDQTVGGSFTIEATVDLYRGGAHELLNEVSIVVNDSEGNVVEFETDEDSIVGTNLSIEKNVVPDYDSGNGNPLINTYPSNIALGDIYHGDWVVYEIIATNDGPQDSFSPLITDTLPVGLEIVDYLGHTNTSVTAPINFVNRSEGGNLIEINTYGKFEVGEIITFRFSARFDQNEAGSVNEICNEVEVISFEYPESEKSPDNNITDECLNVPDCGERQCTAEIFGTDFVRTESNGTVTITGICEIEGTCDLSDRIPTTELSLTYTTCSGNVSTVQVSGEWFSYINSDTYQTTINHGTSQPTLAQLQTDIEGFIGSVYKEAEFELANIDSITDITSTSQGFNFECRIGNPILACVKETCDDDYELTQAWVVGGPEWTDIANVLPPAEGESAPSGSGFVQNFSCNTCDAGPGGGGGGGGGGDGDYCPAGQYPVSDINGNVSCDVCLACGCCDNGADLTVEYEEVIINGQQGFDVIDVFCPDPPGSQPPYPVRSYDFYDGTDLDGDGKPDVCVQYDKSIVSIIGDTITYEISGFLGGVDGSQVTITDTLDLGGVYNNNFVLTASQGAGNVNTTFTNNQAILTVTKTGTESLSFVVTYSVMVGWTGDEAICNSISFDTGSGNPTTDEECACQEGYEYCGVSDTCVAAGEGCGYDKEITDINGDVVSYLITGYIPQGSTSITVVDTLDGSSYNNDFVLSNVEGTGTMISSINGSSVTFDITKTSLQSEAYSFALTYTTTAQWSGQGSGDPVPSCNEVYFSDGTTTISDDEECACPDGWFYCPFTGTCKVDGDPCGYDKVVTQVDGNVISYQITGIVPSGQPQVVINDIIQGATYNSDFAFNATNGAGSMSTSIGTDGVEITINKSSLLSEMMDFVVTYSATASWSYGTDGSPTPICNEIVINDTGGEIGSDEACTCPDQREYCSLTESCIPEGTPCGFDKRVTEINGNIISYEIEGLIPDGLPMIIVTDTIENASYNNDFLYVPVAGSGEFITQFTGDSVDLRITRLGNTNETVRFIIRYTATASWSAGGTTAQILPVCNDITIPTINPMDPIDEECSCPEGWFYCSQNNTCLPEGESCGNDKRIVDIIANGIFYEIDVVLPTGQQSLTVTDTLSGATYDQSSVSFSDTPTNSTLFGTVFNGDEAMFSISRTGISTDTITGTISYGVTSNALFEADGTTPMPVCNDVLFEDGTTFVDLDEECVCPDQWIYCPVTDGCIPEGDECGNQSMCTGLAVSPTVSPSAPLSPSYVCTGIGTPSSIEVTDESGVVVYSSTDMNGTFTLDELGVYEAVCNYDGDTGLECGSGPFSSAQLTMLSNDVRNTLIAQGGDFAVIDWMGYRSGLDDQTYLNTSRENVMSQLQSDTYTYVLSQLIIIYGPSTGGNSNTFDNPQLTINQTVQSAVAGRCTVELCAVEIDVGGGGSVCYNLDTEDDIDIQALNHSVDFTCVAELAEAGQSAEIDCGNASGTGSSVIHTGFTTDLGNGVFGFEGACDYTRVGGSTLFTPTCSIAGVTSGACTEDVILKKGGGGGGPECGDGTVDVGEDCDDGNEISGDGCSSTCSDEGGGGPICGDGTIDDGEECDDGNTESGDGCNASCNEESSGSSGGSGGGRGPLTGGSKSHPCDPNDLIFPGFCLEEEPKCAMIDPPSIQIGEYLPFRWDLELGAAVDEGAQSCGDILEGKRIPGASLKCSFEIYNGSSDEPVMTIPNVSCQGDRWREDNIALFNDFPFEDGFDPMGKSFVKIDERAVGNTFGEYQIVLSEVSYVACGEGGSSVTHEAYRGVSNDRICSMNFAVSDSYMIHKGSSLKTGRETDLGAFRNLDGVRILPQTIVDKIATSQLSNFDSAGLINRMRSFADKYVPLAVSDTRDLQAWTLQGVKKVVSDSVYVYDGGVSRVPLTIGIGAQTTSAKTIIVKNADLIVEGSVYGNILWIVVDGTVTFKNVDCDTRDVVQGFYVTQEGFESIALIDGELQSKIRNDNLGAYERCNDGRLVVDGFLLGPGLESTEFVHSRRALLDQRFNIGYESQADKVFNGASLLFKTNSALWSLLPTGVSEFKDIMQAFR